MTNRSSEIILRLYLALVRLHLDYAAQFWSHYYSKDIGSLEAVQRIMTKMIQELRNLPYKDRLKHLNLHSLERKMARGDMIEVLKWVKGTSKENIDQVLKISSQDRTRGNGYKLENLRFRIDLGRYWFTNRLVNDWNRLGRHVVNAESIGSFKKWLDESMDRDDRWDG